MGKTREKFSSLVDKVLGMLDYMDGLRMTDIYCLPVEMLHYHVSVFHL